MNEVELAEFRIQRLRDAIEKLDDGNKSAFGRRLGYKDGAFVRQLLAGTRPITEKTIMQIEAIHGMHGWFNLPGEARRPALSSTTKDWPFRTVPEDLIRSLADDQLQRLEDGMHVALATMGVTASAKKSAA